MKKLFPAFGLLAASLGLIITSGIFAGGLAKDDDFVDPTLKHQQETLWCMKAKKRKKFLKSIK